MDKKLILDVKNLKTKFRTDEGTVTAVNDISFKLYEKSILGVVGESGSGKTVTNMSIMGLYESQNSVSVSGEVLYRNNDLLKYSKKQMQSVRGGKIAMIFQNPMSCLNPFLTVGEQIVETILLHQKDKSKKEAHDHAIEMLRKVHIPDPEKRVAQYPHNFSGGMRQRVMIAIALSCEPEILIADEPTTALDVTVQAQILDLIEELIENFNTAVIFITHDMGVVARLCKDVCVMYAGRLVERGSVEDIFHRPLHPYTKGLLHSIPHMDIGKPAREALDSIPGNPPNLMRLPKGCSFAPRCEKVTEICNTEMPQETKLQPTDNTQRGVRCFNPLQKIKEKTI